MARLTTSFRVSALLRKVDQEGGSGMILAKGDPEAGGVLLVIYERGRHPRFIEPGIGPSGLAELVPAGPQEIGDEQQVSDYWQRRRRSDPDLWVVELDIASAERFAAATILQG